MESTYFIFGIPNCIPLTINSTAYGLELLRAGVRVGVVTVSVRDG